ncbi:ribonuclease H-like domain-containing protein [Hypoxylon cercidicola]|nr:ribonuclease H-like domain-containing protein [Hypoxylon cercidicola]
MVYNMVFQVDGGCRGNGTTSAIGVAAACLMSKGERCYWTRTRSLDEHDDHRPTSQRAEILAMIIALEWALEKYGDLNGTPRLNVKIYSDSRYAVGCMDEWIYRWSRNGWRNSRGSEIANRCLIQEASHLDDLVRNLGSVQYIHVPREENQLADNACNKALDELDSDNDLIDSDMSDDNSVDYDMSDDNSIDSDTS